MQRRRGAPPFAKLATLFVRGAAVTKLAAVTEGSWNASSVLLENCRSPGKCGTPWFAWEMWNARYPREMWSRPRRCIVARLLQTVLMCTVIGTHAQCKWYPRSLQVVLTLTYNGAYFNWKCTHAHLKYHLYLMAPIFSEKITNNKYLYQNL